MYFCLGGIILAVDKKYIIQQQEYPIPQKPSSTDVSETESGIIDPLVSKQQEEEKSINNNWRRKNQDKRNEIFGFLCDRFWIYVIFLDISNALSHYCTVAWVTRPERPKGVKDIIPKGRYLEVGPLPLEVDSIAVSLSTNSIRRQDPNIYSDTETRALSTWWGPKTSSVL